jgi:hypothetical protein
MQQEGVRFTRSSYEILGLSFLGLFLELAISQWLSSEIRIFAYRANYGLLLRESGEESSHYFLRIHYVKVLWLLR